MATMEDIYVEYTASIKRSSFSPNMVIPRFCYPTFLWLQINYATSFLLLKFEIGIKKMREMF